MKRAVAVSSVVLLAACSTSTSASDPSRCDDARWYAGTFAALPEISGDVVNLVSADDLHPTTYTIPSEDRIAAFGALVDQILDGVDRTRAGEAVDWNAIAGAPASAAGYALYRIHDTGGATTGRYYLLGKDIATHGESAHFLVNPEARRNIVLEAPHAITDPTTEVGALKLFLSDLAPRAAIFSGAERCSLLLADAEAECGGETPTCPGVGFPRSDMAHVTHSLFHAFHERLDDRKAPALFPNAGRARFVQLHFATCEAVFSTGTGDPAETTAISTTIRALVGRRVANARAIHSCNDGDDGTGRDELIGATTNNECGDYNAQALYTNTGSVACKGPNPMTDSNRFLHVEGNIDWLSPDHTVDGTTSRPGWFQVMDAIRDPSAWGACDLACGGGTDCTLGPAQAP